MTREERDYIIYQWSIGRDKEHICNCGNFFHFNRGKEDKPIPPTPQVVYSSYTETEDVCYDYNLYRDTTTYYLSGYNYNQLTEYSSVTTSELIETESEHCGYIPPQPEVIYSSRTEDTEFCSGYDLWKNRTIYYYSGYSEYNLVQYSSITENILIEENSEHCGYRPIIYSSTTTQRDYCIGYDWVNDTTIHYYSGYSEDSLTEYSTSTTSELLEENSEHCGYVDPTTPCDSILYLEDGSTIQVRSYYDNDEKSGYYGKMLFSKYLLDQYQNTCTAVTIGSCIDRLETNDINSKGAFQKYNKLTTVNVPSTIETVGPFAFWNCKNLTSVTISGNIQEIYDTAFLGCESLKDIYFGNTLARWDELLNAVHWSDDLPYGFTLHCTDGDWVKQQPLKKETVAYYSNGSSEEFNIEGQLSDKVFMRNTALERVEIGTGVTSIGDSAFWECRNLSSITISNTVNKIWNYAFYYCTSLTELFIPSSITELSYACFNHCDNLSEITYEGTIEQWNNVKSLMSGLNETHRVIHCTDGDININ